ncbi:MAG TPA: nucleotide disphospho-sugar-binding domain-containing protein [Longimicrobium sp.]|nr:nucleotide disphospho-sugar-binding domain-containing protein [Longimicrobium sp.]
MRELRVLIAAFGDPGHTFPGIALGGALKDRGHRVVFETWEKWRDVLDEAGIEFHAAEEYRVFAPHQGDGPSAGDAAVALAPLLEELRPDVVVNDILTLAPALAAEKAGVPWATLIPHVYPEHEAGLPFFAFGGARLPRTPIGRWLWSAPVPMLEAGLRQGRDELNGERGKAGLAPTERFHGGTSEGLAMVATYPQLEYPRSWPAHVKVTGPMEFETAYEDVELPDGNGPLVLVAPSTAQDPECRLVRVALEALADEPVRVLATTNGHMPRVGIEVPANARLYGWLSYSQAMAVADLVVCHGGHGTVARALGAGVPVLCCPAVGDMAENGARVGWAGVGLALPWRLLGRRSLRVAVRRILRDGGFRERARQIARWGEAHDGAAVGAELVEEFAARSQ